MMRQDPHKMFVLTPTQTQGVPIRLRHAALNWFKGREACGRASMRLARRKGNFT